jgi:hypothetical protein
MGYVINKNGEKIEVNNPEGWCAESVVLVNDDTILVDKYIINLFKKEMWDNSKSESEFIKEIVLNKEPTNEQIIFYLCQNGLNRYSGYATIEKIKTLDFKE